MSQKWRKYSPEFRRAAVEKMRGCANISQLARDLGIRRKWLYEWKKGALQAAAGGRGVGGKAEAERGVIRQLRAKVEQLEKLVARQSLELDFFSGALQLVEERRQKRELSSGRGPTSESGKSRSGKAN